jgi:hypothetical protein
MALLYTSARFVVSGVFFNQTLILNIFITTYIDICYICVSLTKNLVRQEILILFNSENLCIIASKAVLRLSANSPRGRGG